MDRRKSDIPAGGATFGIEKAVGEDGSRLFPVLDSQARAAPDAEAVKAAFDRMMRGLAHGSGERIYSGYRALYEFGHAVVPELERRIMQADWNTVSRPDATRMQTALVTLLHDIDEARSRDVIDHVLQAGCHPSLRGVLNSIRRYDSSGFRIHDIRGLRVLVSREIDESEDVPAYLDRWLASVPPEDLAGVMRLHIVRSPPEADYAGQYMPILSTITVIWEEPVFAGGMLERLVRFGIEKTLYHEIGHHVHRHSFGQQPEQEKEADRYAAARMSANYPWLAGVVGAIRCLLPAGFCRGQPRI